MWIAWRNLVMLSHLMSKEDEDTMVTSQYVRVLRRYCNILSDPMQKSLVHFSRRDFALIYMVQEEFVIGS